MKTLTRYALLVLVALASFTATSFAAAAALPIDSTPLLDLLRPVYESFAGGNSVAGGALALIAVVALLRRYSGLFSASLERALHTDLGGTGAVFVLAGAGAVAATNSLSWAGAKAAFAIGISAVGGYTILRKMIVDRILASSWYATAPAWAKAILSIVTWSAAKPPAIVEAEKAGAAAVEASPSQGAEGIAGKPTKF